MNLKRILYNRKALTVLSICLVISILLGLWIPGSSLNIVQPREPSPINQVAEMELLRLGDRNLENEQMDESEENSETGGLSKEEEKESEETIKEESEDTSEPEREDSKPKQEDSEPEQEDSEPEQVDSEPEETDSEERQPEEKDPQDPGTGDGDDGQEEGLEGEEGGEEADFDIAMVMTWYKYGTQPKTIVCGPSDTVSGDINTAQLVNNELKLENVPENYTYNMSKEIIRIKNEKALLEYLYRMLSLGYTDGITENEYFNFINSVFSSSFPMLFTVSFIFRPLEYFFPGNL